MMIKYFKLHSCCLIVNGAGRSMLHDTQRRKYWVVPHSFAEFIQHINNKEITKLTTDFDENEQAIIKEYLDFLLENELAFFCDSEEELDCFPEMNLEWDAPNVISNAIIEIKDTETLSIIIKAIGDNYIPCIQIVILIDAPSLQLLNSIVTAFREVQHKTLQLLFDNAENFELAELSAFSHSCRNIELITAFNSPEENYLNENGCIIVLTQQRDFTHNVCGVINSKYFNLLLPHFTESLSHNTCLNRKISIDIDGNIKNCPSMRANFGNIKDTTLTEAISKPGFKKHWNITKDEITKCKDCEFRHICTDCRAYIDNPDDIYSAPLKCGYNPYTCEWEEWSSNPLKQKAIEYYGLNSAL